MLHDIVGRFSLSFPREHVQQELRSVNARGKMFVPRVLDIVEKEFENHWSLLSQNQIRGQSERLTRSLFW